MSRKMRKMMMKTVTVLLMGMWIAPLAAQHIFEEQIPVKIQQLRQVEDSVQLVMELDLSMLTIGTERSLLLTPVLVGPGGKEVKMKNLLINGRQRQKVFLRNDLLSRKQRKRKNDCYGVIELNNDNRKVFRYRQSIAFENWMRDARMEIVSDLCGCAGFESRIASEKVADRIILEGAQPYQLQLSNVAYVRPEVEAVKSRSESNNVFLDFQVAQVEINPFFGNNPRELAKIESILKELRADANLRVTGVTITGFASPEGDVQMNLQLSRSRAEALRNYLAMRSGIPPHLYRTGNGGEDWDELARMVQNSYIEPKGAILSIIRTSFGEERKARLKALGGGMVYQRLLHEYYPRLRRVVSRIEYTVRGFNIEEAKQIIKVRPQQLSLNEMFLLANTYPDGSKEFMSVFETAVRIFPDDPVANLNAAASALLSKDLAKAERYLKKAAKNTPAYYNNLGVLNMMQNNYARAKNLFKRAAEGKLEVALKNLEELKKKEETDKLLIN
jgi:outer membrane protein OmpA-like peptidoglycan-associated protein